MNKIFIITLIIYSYCRTSEYYNDCLDGAPTYDNNEHTVSECQKYSKEGNYCCLLSFKIKEEVIEYNLNLGTLMQMGNTNKKKRTLNEKEYLCIGLSKDGYYNILGVKKELEEETGISNIEINCNSSKLNIFILLTYLLLFLII